MRKMQKFILILFLPKIFDLNGFNKNKSFDIKKHNQHEYKPFLLFLLIHIMPVSDECK